MHVSDFKKTLLLCHLHWEWLQRELKVVINKDPCCCFSQWFITFTSKWKEFRLKKGNSSFKVAFLLPWSAAGKKIVISTYLMTIYNGSMILFIHVHSKTCCSKHILQRMQLSNMADCFSSVKCPTHSSKYIPCLSFYNLYSVTEFHNSHYC